MKCPLIIALLLVGMTSWGQTFDDTPNVAVELSRLQKGQRLVMDGVLKLHEQLIATLTKVNRLNKLVSSLETQHRSDSLLISSLDRQVDELYHDAASNYIQIGHRVNYLISRTDTLKSQMDSLMRNDPAAFSNATESTLIIQAAIDSTTQAPARKPKKTDPVMHNIRRW